MIKKENKKKELKKKENISSDAAIALVVYGLSLSRELHDKPQGKETPASVRLPASEPSSLSSSDSSTPAELKQQARAWQEDEQILFSRLLAQIKSRAVHRKRCLQLFTGSGIVAFGMGLAMLMSFASTESLKTSFLVASLIALIAAVVGSMLHMQMITMVANLPSSDVRAIGPLLEALQYADMEGIPQRALMELLPLLEPADAALFNDAHRQNLCRALNEFNTDLVILALKALEKIGDGRAIPSVERLANGGGRARIDTQVLYAAQHCLPILEARAVYDTASQTLLRASEPQAEMGTQLLRSAAEQTDSSNQELLRAAPTFSVSPE